ncbi:ABC transporter ATP-binding protein [Paracoccus fistulariae]|uniref:ABC transporter ATP-binding protein n=1 Tax=Paracoccus fistulariae TaxID=658446 RepID=A0ABY7SJB8_9RHOB|nr:ABC transporter ATP-binding protein [Paracoccus fistulariae]MDB6180873.1 ABC transporter ATP-binding protein [Paracoccus fistulariae]WCR06911.1 ABC transporter ATP-binding protein [Paracoccus fistulariae]
MKTETSGIEIQDLHLSFGDTRVLTGVNLTIEPGEFFGFLGPSGSGKSTLLRSIAGFGPRPSGSIKVGGSDVLSLPPWKRNVGMVFQSYALWPHMSVRDNVAFGLQERKVPAAQIKTRVNDALDLVGLSHLADRMPNQLSGGQQQRIALARTVVIEPQVLLLDEPLSNLDASLRVQMRRELLALQRKLGLTTIFVTHDQEEANSTCDRIAVLDKGVIQQVGRPQDLYDNPVNLFVARFLGTANILEGRIEKSADALRFVTTGGDALPIGSSNPGDAAIVLRPQNIAIGERPDGDTIPGKVLHSEFLGSQIRYIVSAAGSELVVDKSHRQGETTLPTGAEIALQVNMQSAVVLHA